MLIARYGFGLILAGVFHQDPSYGFPPGAPAGAAATISGHASVHNLAFLMIVLLLIAACFVFIQAFRSRGLNGFSVYSGATGIVTIVLLVPDRSVKQQPDSGHGYIVLGNSSWSA